MRQHLEDACEQIDAAVFSGDSFLDSGNRKELREYLGRWERALTVWDIREAEMEEERDNEAML